MRATERVAAMGVAEGEQRVLAVIYEMLDAQELGNVGRVLDTLSESPEAAHMATDGTKWETSGEAAQAVTAVPGDGMRLVADHFDVHLQGSVAWAEGLLRILNQSGGERPVRMTFVLVREHGQWVIVQSHASLPVQDAEIFKLVTR
jgi:ketosteroid isomerase-like protein